ncbi:MAG: phage tail terminator-like protein [Gemmatimonadota bacterium]|nr:phage tail terminator-like protein [Gemmatimonadota bacterium]
MTLVDVDASLAARLGELNLPGSPLVYVPGSMFKPTPPRPWLRWDLIGGPTERSNIGEPARTEIRPLLNIDVAVQDGRGSTSWAELLALAEAIRRGFAPTYALPEPATYTGSLPWDLRVRASGPFSQGPRREGSYLVTTVSIPLRGRA